jgi:hypothetical protein
MTHWDNLPMRDQLQDWGRSFSTRLEYTIGLMRSCGISSIDTAQELCIIIDRYRAWLIKIIELWEDKPNGE